MNQHHTPPPRTPPAGLGHPCGNRLANSHNSFRFERRFNLKVFKAIHHTYQWETNGPGSATSLRLQPDMSAAICCAIAEAHSTSLPNTHPPPAYVAPFFGQPITPRRIILACHKGAIRRLWCAFYRRWSLHCTAISWVAKDQRGKGAKKLKRTH